MIKYVEKLSDTDRVNLLTLSEMGTDKARELLRKAEELKDEDKIKFTQVNLILAAMRKGG